MASDTSGKMLASFMAAEVSLGKERIDKLGDQPPPAYLQIRGNLPSISPYSSHSNTHLSFSVSADTNTVDLLHAAVYDRK